MNKIVSFPQKIDTFHGQTLPEKNIHLAGYAALLHAYDLTAPLPEQLSAVSSKNSKKRRLEQWLLYPTHYMPENHTYSHLVFALKYEGIDLYILKILFNCIDRETMTAMIQPHPTSTYARRIWFLYEWLLETELNLPDASKQNFVDLIDAKLQYPGLARLSKRHRVRNNLPGVHGFCPLIRRTKILDRFIHKKLDQKAQNTISKTSPSILARAAAFLLLQDSKASYTIEGEAPTKNREERWAKAIGQAANNPLSTEEFYRLQEIVIADFRFIHYGYRIEGGFIGIHDRSGLPIPDHVSARWQDIPALMEALIETNHLLKKSDFNAVLAAAIIAFGFVFIHPFEDGNGRIHRYLLHHVLAEKNFCPKNITFPISAVILQKIDQYRQILESYSKPRLQCIEWRATNKGNIEVLNDTADLYRYFDATKQAEFLFECIHETIEKTLPEEVSYLQKYDEFKQFINHYLEMPDKVIELLIQFLRQNQGKLSKRAKQKEFNTLTPQEIAVLEEKYAEIFS